MLLENTLPISPQMLKILRFPSWIKFCFKAKCPKMGSYLTLNPSFANGVFVYPLKASENQIFFYVFRGDRKTNTVWKGLNRKIQNRWNPIFLYITRCDWLANNNFSFQYAKSVNWVWKKSIWFNHSYRSRSNSQVQRPILILKNHLSC